MGWASGSQVAIDIINGIAVQLLEDGLKRGVFADVLDALEAADWDTVDEAMGIDPMFDEVVRDKHPGWFDEPEDEDEEEDDDWGRSETWAIDDEGEQIPGTGSYWEGPEQCEEEWIFDGQCQAEVGHDGPCWCYSGSGSLNQWNHKDDELTSMTPPGHENYIDPIDMAPRTHVALGSWKPIDDS